MEPATPSNNEIDTHRTAESSVVEPSDQAEEIIQYAINRHQQDLIEETIGKGVITDSDVIRLADNLWESDEVAITNLQKLNELRRLGQPIPEQLTRGQKERATLWEDIAALTTGHPLDRHKRQEAITDARLRNIEAIESFGDNPIVENVVDYFFDPDGQAIKDKRDETLLPSFVVQELSRYNEKVIEQDEAAIRPKDAYSIEAVKGQDVARKRRHNAIASSLQQLLQIPGWEHDQYRGFVVAVLERISSAAQRQSYSQVAAYR